MPSSPRFGSANLVAPSVTMLTVAAAGGSGPGWVPQSRCDVALLVSARCLCYCLRGSVAAEDEV
jgi:hypothetical protein